MCFEKLCPSCLEGMQGKLTTTSRRRRSASGGTSGSGSSSNSVIDFLGRGVRDDEILRDNAADGVIRDVTRVARTSRVADLLYPSLLARRQGDEGANGVVKQSFLPCRARMCRIGERAEDPRRWKPAGRPGRA